MSTELLPAHFAGLSTVTCNLPAATVVEPITVTPLFSALLPSTVVPADVEAK